jgi:hypothetical protein
MFVRCTLQSLLLTYTMNEILIRKNVINLIQICVKCLEVQLHLSTWESPRNLYFSRRKSSNNWLLLLVISLICEISSIRSILVNPLTSAMDNFLIDERNAYIKQKYVVRRGKMIFLSFLFIHCDRSYILYVAGQSKYRLVYTKIFFSSGQSKICLGKNKINLSSDIFDLHYKSDFCCKFATIGGVDGELIGYE